MNNYEYCAEWVSRQVGPQGQVLDYGCGAGQIVAALRARGFAAFGCDTYMEAPEAWDKVPAAARPYVTRMDADHIPFEDASFDCVVSNQVIEHVADLDAFIAEIIRVLKPGGRSLHLFPDRGVWIEGHANIPFLHWFPAGSQLRVSYAALMSRMGFGLPLQGKTRTQRYADKCRWLDEWTHYRTRAELESQLQSAFALEHVEDNFFDARIGHRLPIPRRIKAGIAHRLAGTAIVLRSLL